jgi:hypothetical protein
MEERIGQSVDIVASVWDILATMWVTPRLFNSLGANIEIEIKTMLDSDEKLWTFLHVFFLKYFKVMLIIPSCTKWLIWKLRNSN